MSSFQYVYQCKKSKVGRTVLKKHKQVHRESFWNAYLNNHKQKIKAEYTVNRALFENPVMIKEK